MRFFYSWQDIYKKIRAMSNEILNKIVQVNFPANQYVQEETKKTQIYLHHTVSPQNDSMGDINYWQSNSERVATHIIIQGDGTPYQLFSTKYWGYHLGLDNDNFNPYGLPYKQLDKISIGVEIDSWGGLCKYTNGLWYPAKWDNILKKMVANVSLKFIPQDQVWIAPAGGFRGFAGFQKYTTAQIETLRQLLIYWKEKWEIPLKYSYSIFDIDTEALKGTPGVYTHCSVRKDKSDCFPQPELIAMLKML